MNRILLVIATTPAVLAFEVSTGDAAYIGNAPWCAVVNIGAGAASLRAECGGGQSRLLWIEPVLFIRASQWCSAHQTGTAE